METIVWPVIRNVIHRLYCTPHQPGRGVIGVVWGCFAPLKSRDIQASRCIFRNLFIGKSIEFSFFEKQPLSDCNHKNGIQQWHSSSKQYNGSRVSRPFLCARSHGVCVWLVHSSRSNQDNIFTFNATVKHTPSALIPTIRSMQQQQNE